MAGPSGTIVLMQSFGKTESGTAIWWGIIENLIAENLPVGLNIASCAMLYGATGRFNLRTSVVGPDGTEIAEVPAEPVEVAADRKVQLYAHILGVPLKQPGMHVARLYIDDKLASEYPFDLIVKSVK